MVAMGTSLSDKAWGRDSAVYRITGVVSVIGGWFFTAFSAFTLAFLIAMAIKFGGFVAILILVGLAVFFVYRTHIIHKRRSAEDEPQTSTDAEEIFSGAKMLTKCSNSIVKVLAEISEILLASVDGLSNENLKLLRKTQEDVKKLNKSTKSLKDNISKTIAKFDESSIENGQFYVQSMDYLREMAHSISFLNKPMLDHVDNNHKALLDVQIEELNEIVKMLRVFTNRIVQMIKTKSFAQMDGIIQEQQELLKFIDATRKKQVKRIKTNEVGTRNSMLYLGLLSEYKSLALHMVNLAKSFRDFSNSI
jgi:Na+/phosphate symporter